MPDQIGEGGSIATPPASQGRPAHFSVPDLCQARSLGVIVLVCQLLVLVLLFAGEPGWTRLALLSLYVQWIGLCSAGLLCLLRGHLLRYSLATGALAAYVMVLLVTLVIGLAADQIMATLMLRETPGIQWQSLAQQLAIAAIIAGMVLRYFYVQQRLREQEQAELQARIQSLQSRIRPHFLFNSMNIIASLIAVDPDNAERVVEDLAALFRASLNEAGHQVSLAEELDLCERYLRIEQLRLGDRLRIHWSVAPGLERVRLPLLTLQPLVENAIYHGVQPRPDGGDVRLSTRASDERLEIRIENPLPQAPDAEAQGNRMAIANIRSRLQALYGDRARLETSTEDGTFITRLLLPLQGG